MSRDVVIIVTIHLNTIFCIKFAPKVDEYFQVINKYQLNALKLNYIHLYKVTRAMINRLVLEKFWQIRLRKYLLLNIS